MKRILALLLCLITLLSLAACGNKPNDQTEPTKETTPVDTYPYPQINTKLTRDALNALPVKSDNMTIQQMRETCVQFMRFSKTALWTPNNNMQFLKNTSDATDEITKGIVYAGLPYVGRGGCGNVYRMLDNINEETGVMDMKEAIAFPALFGNHCSSCTYWAWSRVISSVSHAFTASINNNNGYLRIGPYTYDDSIPEFSDTHTTTMVCQDNGLNTMCQSYAQLHLADGLVNYIPGGGHVIMVSSEPHVEYVGDQIDPAASYITVLDQGQTWEEYVNEAGDKAQVKARVDSKVTFLQLFKDSYIPFSFAEFLGTKPVEKTQCRINLSGDSVSSSQLFRALVTSNFGISDIYVTLKNADNKEVYRLVVRADSAGLKEVNINRSVTNAFSWGDYDSLSGEYAAEVSVQLSTGERPVVYSGKVTMES